MSKNRLIIILLLGCTLLLSGCVGYEAVSSSPPRNRPSAATAPRLPYAGSSPARHFPGLTRLPPLVQLRPMAAGADQLPFEKMLFSLSTRGATLEGVLFGLAREAGLNLVIGNAVDSGRPVSVEFKDIPLRQALELILSSCDYFYTIDGNILYIKALETRIFHFDYALVSNKGETDDSSSGGDSSSSGPSGSSGFSISSENNDDALKVWDMISSALGAASSGSSGSSGSTLLSPEGRAEINPMGGLIIVTDRRENLDLVERYLDNLRAALQRQVIIEAKIIQVTLSKNFDFGIDWTMLANDFIKGGTLAIATNFASGASGLKVVYKGDPNRKNVINGVLDALASQGDVKVLSSPRINVLNNQSAVFTVGRQIPYLQWQAQSSTDEQTVVVPEVVTAQTGISLGITPQIDAEGTVTLHIVPAVADLSEYKTFSYDNNTFEVPVINTRTTDTLVRVEDGNTIIIGGLITEITSNNSAGVPYISGIPLLGNLFKQQHNVKERVELVIMLTPTVVKR